MLVRPEHRSNRIDGHVEAPHDLAIRVLEPARARNLGIEVCRETRAIGAKGVELRRQCLLPAIGFASAIERRLECIERQGKTLGSGVDCACLSHRPPRQLEIFLLKRFFLCQNGDEISHGRFRQQQPDERPCSPHWPRAH